MQEARTAAEAYIEHELQADLARATSPRLSRHEAAVAEAEATANLRMVRCKAAPMIVKKRRRSASFIRFRCDRGWYAFGIATSGERSGGAATFSPP